MKEMKPEGASYKAALTRISSMADELNDIIDSSQDLPSWVQDKITISNHNMDAILSYFESKDLREGHELSEEEYDEACEMMENLSFVSEGEKCGFQEMEGAELNESTLEEAEYRGRKVKLGKIMKGDVKKFKVYVKNNKGNVVKVNFGQKGVKIKKNNPKRRKSFRARHNCDNPGPRWKARYWSCRKW